MRLFGKESSVFYPSIWSWSWTYHGIHFLVSLNGLIMFWHANSCEVDVIWVGVMSYSLGILVKSKYHVRKATVGISF